jgi:hypothetical protein
LRSKDETDLIESIEHITNDLPKFAYKQLTHQISRENAVIIIEFIKCQKTEINPSDAYKNVVIRSLITLIKYFDNKNFKQLTRVDIINYLDSLRKSEQADPIHKWIGTYNLRRQLFLKFFKWLYDPAEEAKIRKIPEVMRDIPLLKRKEQSIYKPDDLWTPKDDQIFLQYCSDKRMQCYHAISRDTSARPSEILKLRVKEINFKLAGDKSSRNLSEHPLQIRIDDIPPDKVEIKNMYAANIRHIGPRPNPGVCIPEAGALSDAQIRLDELTDQAEEVRKKMMSHGIPDDSNPWRSILESISMEIRNAKRVFSIVKFNYGECRGFNWRRKPPIVHPDIVEDIVDCEPLEKALSDAQVKVTNLETERDEFKASLGDLTGNALKRAREKIDAINNSLLPGARKAVDAAKIALENCKENQLELDIN